MEEEEKKEQEEVGCVCVHVRESLYWDADRRNGRVQSLRKKENTVMPSFPENLTAEMSWLKLPVTCLPAFKAMVNP